MRITRALWILPGLLACLGGSASADDAVPADSHPERVDILAYEGLTADDPSWLSAQLDRVHVHKKRGFAYTHSLSHGEHPLEWSVQGPAVGRKKAVGLGFELRF